MLVMMLVFVLQLSGEIHAKGVFTHIDHEWKWYRSFDESSQLWEDAGDFLYVLNFEDPDKAADSFYVGIDTLWLLPSDVNGDEYADWDLQHCLDAAWCLQGINAGVFGDNAPKHFGVPLPPDNLPVYSTHHHINYYPAFVQDGNTFVPIAPSQTILGALMYARSRSTGASDTIFAFGAWKMAWDDQFPPPFKPVNGYLPTLSDFVIADSSGIYIDADTFISGGQQVILEDTLIFSKIVRYQPGNTSIATPPKSLKAAESWRIFPQPLSGNSSIQIESAAPLKTISLIDLQGRTFWYSSFVAHPVNRFHWDGLSESGGRLPKGIYFLRGITTQQIFIQKFVILD